MGTTRDPAPRQRAGPGAAGVIQVARGAQGGGQVRDVPPWTFDEFRDLGFSSESEIAEYERRSGATPEGERERLRGLGSHEGHALLELGCGTGLLAVEAAKLCREVVAVDVSQAMLSYARRKAAGAGVDNVSFQHAGFLTVEVEAESTDVVVTQRALHRLPDFWKVQALHRIVTMLRSGGVFYLNDLVYSFAPERADAAIAAWIDATAAKREASGFPRSFFEAHVREEHGTYAWLLEAMLERVGFVIRSVRYDSCEAYAAYTCLKR